jgi:hypothetical protein
MMETNTKKVNLSWLGIVLLIVGFAEFVFVYLLQDKAALTSSIYTYYQNEYYVHLSKFEVPWINFRFEYPPLAAYVLLFPAFVSGLSVLWVSILRGFSTLILTLLTIRYLNRCERIPKSIQNLTSLSIGVMAVLVPGFYFGLFDWALVLCNILMALVLFGREKPTESEKAFWPLVFFGASIKLMPLMAAPFLFQVKSLREKSNFVRTLVITTAIHIPFLLFGFQNFRHFVSYHRMRSIDCLSTYACMLNALERLGKVTIERKWNYGALELNGSLSALFSKASLPAFLMILVGLLLVTRNLIKKGMGAKAAFGMYLVAFLAYPAVSKVSQGNYCVWSAATLFCFWLIGYQRQEFVRRTFFGIILLLAIGWYQDQRFEDFMLPMVPWSMIVVSSFRQILTLALAVYCLKEILLDAKQNQGTAGA